MGFRAEARIPEDDARSEGCEGVAKGGPRHGSVLLGKEEVFAVSFQNCAFEGRLREKRCDVIDFCLARSFGE